MSCKVENCCICLESLSQNVRVLRCGHKLHSACANGLQGLNPLCPLCREPLYVDSIGSHTYYHRYPGGQPDDIAATIITMLALLILCAVLGLWIEVSTSCLCHKHWPQGALSLAETNWFGATTTFTRPATCAYIC